MQKFIIHITEKSFELLKNEQLECFIINSDLPDSFKAEFAKIAKENQKLVLSYEPETTIKFNLDGVVLDRRHEAMLVGECEPDFVVFRAWTDGQEKVRELTTWFDEMFLLQSALLPVEDVDYGTFKTDFVILEDTKI